MGIYGRHILPVLTDWAMGQGVLNELRSRVIGGAQGRVLEIGVGSGRNLPFYGDGTHEIVGVDPSAELLLFARRSAAAIPHPVSLIEQTAENLPFDDASSDTVVV